MAPPEHMQKIGEHTTPRRGIYLFSILLGILFGVANAHLDLEFTLAPPLIVWLAAAVLTVVFLHEGVHGTAAILLGHRPIYGLRFPLIYVTFSHKIARRPFILIALAPLLLLNLFFAALYGVGILKLYANLCFVINTLGALGDVWSVLKLLSYGRGVWIQDTKNGLELWRVSGN